METAVMKKIYTDEYINIFSADDNVYIQTIKKGYPVEQVYNILLQYPHIEVTNLQNAINQIETQSYRTPELIGRIKKRIQIDVSPDGMLATVMFNLTEEELGSGNRAMLIKDIVMALKEKGITYGIQRDILTKELSGNVKYTIAEGTPAMDGTDSIIKMFELTEIKPEAIEGKKIDYYNLSLITAVEADTWLGERIEATAGIEGRTVNGEIIMPVNGTTFPLQYDKTMIYEVCVDNRTILYSKEYGAIHYVDNNISIMNPLIINGDVGFKTGNIVFDGFIIINGTIGDGFYVEATNDIEVNGELGLGNIKGIVSKQGSIYIKGGILSKGDTRLEAKKNIYTKFIENVTIDCGGSAHIGFYSSNSTINAKEVIIDSSKGKIMGGFTKAEIKVVSPVLGSEIGKRTIIEVAGFNKNAIKSELDLLIAKIEELKSEHEQIIKKISFFSSQASLTTVQTKILNNYNDRLLEIRNELKKSGERKNYLEYYINTRGEGEIRVAKKIYPNTSISIKKSTLEISAPMLSPSFVWKNGKIIEL